MNPAALALSGGQPHLLRDLASLVERDRRDTATMLAYVAEIDRRKLYLEHACPSMFAFCVQRFHMSEAIAVKRIRGGRAAHDPTQVETPFDFDRLGRLVAAFAAL